MKKYCAKIWYLFTYCIHGIVKVLAEFGGYAAVAMMLLTVSNITIRIFWKPITGTYELVGLLSVVFSSFAITYTTLKHCHIAVNVLTSRLPQRAQAICNIIVSLIGVLLLFLMAWTGGKFAMEQWVKKEITDTLYIPIAPFRFVLVVALVFFCLILVMDLINSFIKVVRK